MTNHWTNLRACVSFALLFGVCYGGAAWWTSTLPGPLPSWDFAFEQRVPFVPWLSLVYLTITPALLLAPWLLRKRKSSSEFLKSLGVPRPRNPRNSEATPRNWNLPMFAFALSVQTVIATVFFLLFPLTNAWVRPEVDGWAFRLADALNLAHNEFPSLHVAFAVSAAWAYRRWYWSLWAIAVAISAWLMWEHHLVEIVAGMALAVVVMRVAERESTWVELCCLAQCARFSRRHIRYFVIFVAIWGPSLLHWRRYRAVRWGFCSAQWIDDLLDGDRPSEREPLEVIDDPTHPLARLVRAFLAEVPPAARQEFHALVQCMRVDRLRVLGRERWTAEQLDEHHRRTFTLSVDLMLTTAGCTARASEVPSLIDALAWCSVFRDLDDDLRKGLDNIPVGADVPSWTRTSHTRACANLDRAAAEIAALTDARAQKLLTIFHRSIMKYTRTAAVPAADRPASRRPESAGETPARQPAGRRRSALSGATTARTSLRMPQPQQDLPPHLRPIDPPLLEPEPLPLEDLPPPPPPPHIPTDDRRQPDPYLRRT